ncbi:MAG: FMN-binding negative transcriptional regulator [Rhodospirillaceae bacterium]|nr:FMN-binding negative transcriptional regulator [Rhodospirillaceae bacterium]
MAPFYIPDHHRKTDLGALHGLMRAYPFATVITDANGDLAVSHIPLHLDDTVGSHGVLRGHVARANPHWRDLADGKPSLVIFNGPQAYVTPQWYPSKAEHARVVPTWNYAVVHAHGTLRALTDKDWLLANVTELTEAHEAAFAHRWSVSDAPEDYIDKMLKAIVGLEFTITRLEGKWKLSQHRAEPDRLGTINGLAARAQETSAAVAELMHAQ